MKYLFVVFATMSFFTAMGQSSAEAAEYNNDILGSQRSISRKSMRYLKVALYSDNVSRIERKRAEVLNELKKAKKKVAGKDAYYGDSGLKDAMLAYLNASLNGYEGSFRAANEMWEERRKSYENLKRYYEMLEKGEAVMDEAGLTFNKAQEAFAERHGVMILDDEGLSEKVALFNAANHYSRKIELIHFRTYSVGQKYLVSLNEGKYKSLEIIRKEILASSKKSQTELEELEPFKGDTELRMRVKESLRFYESAANNEFKTVADILGEKGGRLSQAEANKVNKSMETVNQKTSGLYTKYFEALRSLLRKYIPEED